MLEGCDRILVFLFLRQQNAVKQPAPGAAGHLVKRTLSRGKRPGIISLRLLDFAQLFPQHGIIGPPRERGLGGGLGLAKRRRLNWAAAICARSSVRRRICSSWLA